MQNTGKPEKKPVYKLYDYFRVNNPYIVERVGYPLSFDTVRRELNEAMIDRRIKNFLGEFGLYDNPIFNDTNAFSPTYSSPDYVPHILEDSPQVARIKDVLASCLLRDRGYGGNERTIHEIHVPSLLHVEYQIVGKRVVRTGNRVAPSGHGEDYEPGYLDDMKTHVLLKFYHPHAKWGHWEINSAHVEKVYR